MSERRAEPAAPAPAAGDPALSPTGRVQRPVVLIVLDGWGCAPDGPGNAVSLAHTPVFDRLLADYPHGTLDASGPAVGLPPGQMGNSEVGHLNIGAGRVVYQDLTRISKAIEDGDFFANRVLKQACAKAVGRGSTLHLMGLVSGGGVHSDMGHLEACLELAAREKVQRRRGARLSRRARHAAAERQGLSGRDPASTWTSSASAATA